MKNMKRAVKKGFTLLELIIVMALFSILMVAVMSMADPVSRIFKNTSVSARTYNYANDIQVYIDTKLKYADNVWVVTGSDLDTAHLVSKKKFYDKHLLHPTVALSDSDPDFKLTLGNGNSKNEVSDIARIVEAYRYEYYDNIVQPDPHGDLKSPDNHEAMSGKIYVMRLINNPGSLDGEVSGEIQGQISMRKYDFDSDTAISASANPAPSIELNPAYFSARDAVYDYNYTLGASKFVNVTDDSRALEGDMNGDKVTFSNANPAVQLTIVLDQEKGVSDDSAGYRTFGLPCTATTCSTPLINIIERKGLAQGRYIYDIDRDNSPIDDSVKKIQKQNSHKADVEIPYSFMYLDSDFDDSNNEADFDFTQDIYFIFSYADELE